jgi:hypothetical protein
LSKNWKTLVALLSSQQCIAALIHFLRKLESPLITSTLCRWFLENEAIADENHRFQLFYSLVHCLPENHRKCLELISSGLDFGCPVKGLGGALLGLPVGHFAGECFVQNFLCIPLCFSPSYVNTTPFEGNLVVASCKVEHVLNVVVDPYYSSLKDAQFLNVVAEMYEYIWPSPDAVVLACGHQLRRFMRPEVWAIDARNRLMMFLRAFVAGVDGSLTKSNVFAKNWSWLLQLLSHAKNLGQEGDKNIPQAFLDSVKFLCTFKFKTFRPDPPVERHHDVEDDFLVNSDPKIVAATLRRFFLEPFQDVTTREMCKNRFLKADTAPHFGELVKRFNGLQNWVIDWVLEAEQAKDRGARLTFVIRCAHHCVKINNFHAGLALYFGVSDPAIGRLSKSWKFVPPKVNNYLTHLKSLADPSVIFFPQLFIFLILIFFYCFLSTIIYFCKY